MQWSPISGIRYILLPLAYQHLRNGNKVNHNMQDKLIDDEILDQSSKHASPVGT